MDRITCYMILGLGADERILANQRPPSWLHITPVAWVTPLPKETMDSYASRLIPQIDQSRPFVIAGVSFGGILAGELSEEAARWACETRNQHHFQR